MTNTRAITNAEPNRSRRSRPPTRQYRDATRVGRPAGGADLKTTRPTIAVLASFDPALLQAEAKALRRLAKLAPLALSGPGASNTLCTQLGVRRLDGDLVDAANDIAHATND